MFWRCFFFYINEKTRESQLSNGDNVQAHNQGESKLNNTIILNCVVNALIDGRMIKNSCSKNNVITIINK